MVMTASGSMESRREIQQDQQPPQRQNVLDYSNSYWGDDKCVDIVEAVRHATYPVLLDLRGNRIEAAGAKVIAEMLKTQHSVVSVCLEWNNVGLLDEGVEGLATALEVDTRLLELDLRNNNIGPEGAKALAKALKRNRTLKKLDLRWNEIGNAGALAFLEALQSNHSLLALELTGNNSSFKHAEEIERLVERNRSIQGKHVPEAREQQPQDPPQDPSKTSGYQDQLLLQVLGEKEGLETDLNVAKRYNIKLSEKVEENELQIEMLRKEIDSVKQDRDRYQQREIDAKAEAHEVRMRLEELENRRRVEYEEYRMSRTTLERECNVMRDKMSHIEALYQKNDDIKTKQISQLEELKYKLESEVHRSDLSAGSQQEEYQKIKKELADTAKEYERKEQRMLATHKSELANVSRQHELTLTALQAQVSYATEQLNDARDSLASIKEKHDANQALLLQERLGHEKQVHELKTQWEKESHERMQRSVAAVEAQVEEIKKSRVFLEREIEKHLDTIVRLRQENITAQQANDERLQTLQQELDRQYKELQDKQDQFRDAHKDATKAKEKAQQYHRRVEEQERSIAQMKETYQDHLREQRASAESTSTQLRATIQEKIDAVEQLEKQLIRVQCALSQQIHEHEQRFDGLAEAMGVFLRDQLKREHDRRERAQMKSNGVCVGAAAAGSDEGAHADCDSGGSGLG